MMETRCHIKAALSQHLLSFSLPPRIVWWLPENCNSYGMQITDVLL